MVPVAAARIGWAYYQKHTSRDAQAFNAGERRNLLVSNSILRLLCFSQVQGEAHGAKHRGSDRFPIQKTTDGTDVLCFSISLPGRGRNPKSGPGGPESNPWITLLIHSSDTLQSHSPETDPSDTPQ